MNMFEYYGLFREEHNKDRLTQAETKIIEYLFDKYLPAEGKVLDSAAGEGTFAFRFAERGYSVTAGDLLSDHVEAIRSDSRSQMLAGTYCASPRNLSQFESGSFDIVLSLGPMYHARTKAERETLVREALRVLSPEGYIAFTYMTPFAMTLGQYFTAVRTYNNLDKLKAFRKLANVEKSHDCDMFYGMTLDEMTDISREYGMKILTVASTYGMLYNMVGEIDAMSDEEYKNFLQGQIATCEDPFVARYCMRGLFIAQKKQLDLFD
ncbi:MAG: class I SAM-dependent methyltransferase [Clostridia bacterium]|nr:class I SAM-dependent methyltransferase [Clostridia bacterium]